jgi:hypothetical protein
VLLPVYTAIAWQCIYTSNCNNIIFVRNLVLKRGRPFDVQDKYNKIPSVGAVVTEKDKHGFIKILFSFQMNK